MLSFAQHFKQKSFSDCHLPILLRPQEDPVDGRPHKRAKLAADDQQSTSFPAHQIILCALEYFNAQAQNWQSASSNKSSNNLGSSKHQHEAKANNVVLTLTISSADEFEAAEAVVATLYGVKDALRKLQHDQLVQSLIIADMIGAATAAKQASQHLKTAADSERGLSNTALETLAGLSAWPECLLKLVPVIVSNASCCSKGISDLAALQAAGGSSLIQRILLSAFGDLQSVWRDTRLRDLLLQLPCAAMQLLLSSDQLQVPSEDIVLYTAQWYAGKQYGNRASAAVRSALAGLVRVPYLSDVMLHYAALVDISSSSLLKKHPKQTRQLLLLRRVLKDLESEEYKQQLALIPDTPNSWQLGQRQSIPAASAIVVWKLPVRELKEACQWTFRYSKAKMLYSPESAPLSGFVWAMRLHCKATQSGVVVSVSVEAKDGLDNFYYGLRFAVSCTGVSKKCNVTCLQGNQRYQLHDFFGVGAMPGGWDKAAWAAKCLPTAGDLVIKLKVSSVL